MKNDKSEVKSASEIILEVYSTHTVAKLNTVQYNVPERCSGGKYHDCK